MLLNLTQYEDNELVPQELKDFFSRSSHRHTPFEALLFEFCQQLCKKLSIHSDPDLAALGFWLRPAQLNELKRRFEQQGMPTFVRTARGLAFHITASNVDTLFAYSWMLSLLVGNSNIVRLPSKQSYAIDHILDAINTLFQKDEFASIAQANCLIQYAHQRKLTAAISEAADIRIIWGSNQTIQDIRSVPLNPYAKEIAFPDRFSYAAIASNHYANLKHQHKTNLAQAFFRDAYGFDQHGCSSPRLIFWIGSEDDSHAASTEFYNFLHAEIQRRGYRVPLSDFLHKQTALYSQCAQSPVKSVKLFGNELSILHMNVPLSSCVHHPGAGLFYHVGLSHLLDIEQYISLHDQTLTYYGFESTQVKALITRLKGKGPSRIVPIGEALHFSSIWDGFDLLQELTRCIEINLPSAKEAASNAF